MRADLQLGFFSPARKALWSLMLSLKSCLSLSRIPAFARKPESKKWRKTSSIQGQGPRGAPQATVYVWYRTAQFPASCLSSNKLTQPAWVLSPDSVCFV